MKYVIHCILVLTSISACGIIEERAQEGGEEGATKAVKRELNKAEDEFTDTISETVTQGLEDAKASIDATAEEISDQIEELAATQTSIAGSTEEQIDAISSAIAIIEGILNSMSSLFQNMNTLINFKSDKIFLYDRNGKAWFEILTFAPGYPVVVKGPNKTINYYDDIGAPYGKFDVPVEHQIPVYPKFIPQVFYEAQNCNGAGFVTQPTQGYFFPTPDGVITDNTASELLDDIFTYGSYKWLNKQSGEWECVNEVRVHAQYKIHLDKKVSGTVIFEGPVFVE
ncbi:hypothetical protein IT409_01155 [Candidatus Falkowbacteria bacterium]|nr:hypothetical protein [Candidatus Falkowbacteria bacterium]